MVIYALHLLSHDNYPYLRSATDIISFKKEVGTKTKAKKRNSMIHRQVYTSDILVLFVALTIL